jgi:hypothetical protein
MSASLFRMLRRSALLAVPLLALTLPPASADEDNKVGSIKQIMEEAHRCRTAYVRVVGEQLRKEEPDWKGAETTSRELIRMGKLLALNTPPKGSKESWEHLTSVYVAHATLLTDATMRKDKDTALQHQQKLYRMCSTCHKAHR